MAEPLKVLHVITGLQTGGAERLLERLVLARRDPAIRFQVVALLPRGAVAERLADAGIPVIPLGMRRGFPDPRAVFRLARLIRTLRPDVVQSWLYHADLIATLALIVSGRRKMTRLYWNLRCASMEGGTRSFGQAVAREACAWLSRIPDGVVANSEAGRAFHLGIGYRPRKFLVIDNGVDCDAFRPDNDARRDFRRELEVPEDRPLIAMIARLDPVKDHATFLKALAKLPQVTALVAGEGTENLPAMANLRRLGERGDIARILAACDAVVSTSTSEGFPNTILEGMAAGLPVVATDAGDSKRIVGDCGIVVPVGDWQAAASAIERLLGDAPQRRRERSIAARRRAVEQFGLARMVAAFDAIYRGKA